MDKNSIIQKALQEITDDKLCYYQDLNDGAQKSFSDGLQMNTISSIIELLDNSNDANSIYDELFYDEKNNTLTLLSKELSNLDDITHKVIFNFGTSHKLRTKQNGIGKYSQGLKLANSNLIDKEGTAFYGLVNSKGEKKGWYQYINYENEENYTDRKIYDLNGNFEIKDGFNFKVEIDGCKKITNDILYRLSIEAGLRYRYGIENGEKTIKINNASVRPQDRLYKKFLNKKEKNIDFYDKVFLPWNGVENAVSFEWVDLTNADIEEEELIDLDNMHGRGNRPGVNVLNRAGLEIVVNGVTITYGKDVTEDFCDIQFQQSCIPFRGRLEIFNNELNDKLLIGSNKSLVKINKEYIKSDEMKEIVELVKEAVIKVKSKNSIIEGENVKEKSVSNKIIDDFCESNGYDCKFYFTKDRPAYPLFDVMSDKSNSIYVNLNTDLKIKERSIYMLICSLLFQSKKDWKSISNMFNNTYNELISTWKKF